MTHNVGELLLDEPREWHDLSHGASQANYQPLDHTGQLIGPYKVLRSLGQGGMGEVFLAERADHQFEQRVAIKLVKREVLSKQVQSRLRVERQILANLEHPNIARLLDGGSTSEGIPYLVMEYVDGEPIDTYCDAHSLSISQRLQLFLSVCAAVHSAHQNLIVHRDLKPSNILVTNSGVPKLLDFGIAKILDARQLTQTLALTEADYRMLTPDHASPEQLTGDLITTASDIYVLGVLLYELLTGCKPFTIKGHSFAELERMICEQPPLPPSQIFSSSASNSAQHVEEIAKNRSTTVAKLRRELQGDLSSIILMALRKEPERRYSSVRQFSEDIGRYLQGLPVNARLDTWAYRAAKFIKRHAVVVGLAAVLAVTLLASTIFLYVNSVELVQQRDVADKQSATATAIAKFLTDLFNAPNPDEARGEDPTVLEFLEKAPERIRTELSGQKEVQARLLNTIGFVYMRLGKFDRAESLLLESWSIFRQELNIKTIEVADVALNLGELHLRRDDLRRAEQFYVLSIELSRSIEGPEGRGSARGQCGLGYVQVRRNELAEAANHLRQCLALYESLRNIEASELAIASDALASTLALSGRLAEAEVQYRRWLANQNMPQDSTRVLEQKHNLATVLQREGKLQEAVELYRDVVEGGRRVWRESEQLADALTNYGWGLQELEQYEEAEGRFKEAESINRTIRATEVNRAYLMARMAGLALDRGRPKDAESGYRQALGILNRLDTDRFRASMLVGLSKTLLRRDQADEAQERILQALPLLEKGPGKSGYLYGLAQSILGRARWQRGMRDPAVVSQLQEGYEKYTKQRGPKLPEARLLRSWLDDAESAASNSRPSP